MRPYCLDCVIKHLAQAHILLHEAKLGYPAHDYLAMGHLAQAEAEIIERSLETAQAIRKMRKCIEEEEGGDFNIFEWIEKIEALDE